MTITMKRCAECHRNLPTDNFYPQLSEGTLLRNKCKACTLEANRASRERLKLGPKRRAKPKPRLIGTQKKCRGCGEDKDLSFFHRNANEKDGRQLYCKTCRAKMNRNYMLGVS